MPSVVLGGRRGGGSGLAIVVFIVASSAEFQRSIFSLCLVSWSLVSAHVYNDVIPVKWAATLVNVVEISVE